MEWAALAAVVLGLITQIGVQYKTDIDARDERAYRDKMVDYTSETSQYERLRSMGLNESAAIQAVSGSNMGYSTPAITPNNSTGVNLADFNSILAAMKQPSEIDLNAANANAANADAVKSNAETEWLPKISAQNIAESKERINSMIAKQSLDNAQAKSIMELLEANKAKTWSEVELNQKALCKMDAEINSTLQTIEQNWQRLEQEVKESQSRIVLNQSEVDVNSSQIGVNEAQIGHIAKENELIDANIVNLGEDTNLKITQQALNQAKATESKTISLKNLLDAIEQDYNNYLRENGYAPELYSGNMTNKAYNNQHAIEMMKNYKERSKYRSQINSGFLDCLDSMDVKGKK